MRRYNGIPPYEQTHAYVRAVLGRGRPAADVQEPEEEDPSGDQAHAGSEADLAEGAPAEPQLQDDHLAADGAAGLEPWALDEAAELDPAADTVRFVLHRGADRLTVDVEPGHDPERPLIAAMQASDHGGTTGIDGVSATTATATSSSTRHTSRWSEPSSTGADIVVAAQAGLVLVRVDGPIEDVVDKLRRETSAGLPRTSAD